MRALPCLLALLVLAAPAAALDLEWARTHDGGAAYTDEAVAALVDPAGDLIVGGVSHDGVTGADLLLRKLDRATGDPLWTLRVPSYDGNDMALTAMEWDGRGDLLVASYIVGCAG
ncbi:MAG: hypothetical protein JW819_02730 [Candidatus Krumholzibacteriota bacterium]|nr:hypothetical protein [Candidatus Krumholzibacteriota bacterium]